MFPPSASGGPKRSHVTAYTPAGFAWAIRQRKVVDVIDARQSILQNQVWVMKGSTSGAECNILIALRKEMNINDSN